MNCPTCSVALLITERQGIEIDYCPQCRGVWLDRGELDKLIERAGMQANTAMKPREEAYREDDEDPRGHQAGYGMAHGRGRERENPIAELFDFF